MPVPGMRQKSGMFCFDRRSRMKHGIFPLRPCWRQRSVQYGVPLASFLASI
jgi:hypothetical protein